MFNLKEENIKNGEAVLRKTIVKLNKEIRELATVYNKKVGFYKSWDYKDVYSEINSTFAGSNYDADVVRASQDGRPLYTRMKYATLIAFNNFLGRIVDNLNQKNSMLWAIQNAKIDRNIPQEFYDNYSNAREVKYDLMLDGINEVRNEMSRRFGMNNFNIYCLDEVLNERKSKEDASEKVKLAKKLAKSETAKKVMEETFKTKTPETKQAYEANLWEEEVAEEKEQSNSLRDVQLFDEEGVPVYEHKDRKGFTEYTYADGSVYYGNIYDEQRNAVIIQEDIVEDIEEDDDQDLRSIY
ncbi:MAG: hypothetical protein IJT25_02810 [Clostridia bacterium]|nr:hypothetical protein [Clostridia bacterium]